MTNKDYLTKSLSGMNVSEDDIDIILIKSGLNPNDEVDVKDADFAIYNRMSLILKNALQNVTEGGYQISWNVEAVKLFYSALCAENGFENVLNGPPKLRDKSDLW